MIREVHGAGQVAAVQCTAHEYTDPGKPRIAWNDEQARADAPPKGPDESSTETGQCAEPSGPAGGHERLPAAGADAER